MMSYSKEFWLSAGAVVLAVIIVVAVIRLRSEEVQRAPLFSRPGELAEATEEFDVVQSPEPDVIIERDAVVEGDAGVEEEAGVEDQKQYPHESLQEYLEMAQKHRRRLYDIRMKIILPGGTEQAEQLSPSQELNRVRSELEKELEGLVQERAAYLEALGPNGKAIEALLQDIGKVLPMIYGEDEALEKWERKCERAFAALDERIEDLSKKK